MPIYRNRLRGLISEFGIVLPQKVTGLRQHLGKHPMEAPVRVFHWGPGKMPNMTVGSFAVLHLLTQLAQVKSDEEAAMK